MLKIIYHNCYGIDIHKTFVISVAAIINDHNVTQYYRRRFSISTKALLEFYFCFNICMESTDKYLIPVFNVLESFRNICLVFSPQKKYIKVTERIIRKMSNGSLTFSNTI